MSNMRGSIDMRQLLLMVKMMIILLMTMTIKVDTLAQSLQSVALEQDRKSANGGNVTARPLAVEYGNVTQVRSRTPLSSWTETAHLEPGWRRGDDGRLTPRTGKQRSSRSSPSASATPQQGSQAYTTVKPLLGAKRTLIPNDVSSWNRNITEPQAQPFVATSPAVDFQPGPAGIFSTARTPQTANYSAKRRMARQEGDLIIGALFPVHHHPPIQTAYSRVCGKIREYYGIQRIETFLLTLDRINSDPSILPNITLGWDIRDSCWYSAIALEQSIDFIHDAIASNTMTMPTGKPAGVSGKVSARDGRTHHFDQNTDKKVSSEDPGCSSNINKPIVGLVGPGSSEASIQVQNLMQIFNIPQIGYSATTMDLSDKNIFRYFMRVVPPDNYQVQALVDLVLAFNWTYISTVHSDGNYGIRGIDMFKDLVASYNICIASTDSVASSDSDLQFNRVVDVLKKTPNASVVVCFCEGITVQKLLQAINRKGEHGKFLIIGSDGWGNRLDVVKGQKETAAGGISIKLYSPPLPAFHAYYASLRPNSSTTVKNPWFREFWQQKFQCYLPGLDEDTAFTRPCSGSESLADSDQDSKLGFVVNAVETMALALHAMYSDLCPGGQGLCSAMTPVNGTLFLHYLLNVSFPSYSGHDVHFDDNGDPPGRYEILNYQPVTQADGKVIYEYVTIGRWMTGNLELNESAIYWPGKGRNPEKPFSSTCSEPCGAGFVKQGVGSDGTTCCWVCTPCQDNEIVIDEADCEPCTLGWWPNHNKTDCQEIPVEFVTWRDTGSIVVLVVACVGLLSTAWVTAIFIRSHNTPVVKASTRELSYILLLGIALAFSCNFLFVSQPAPALCYLSRIVPGLAFSLMYGALVTRTNRIARILEGSKRIMTKKPRFMSATAQVVITGIIIGMECVILSTMLLLEQADSKMDYSVPKRVRLICNTSTLGIIVPLGFDLFLIFMCTLYAVKTRNLPENFNEAKFIGFTMYTTCVIWLGFFPIYFGGQNKEVTMAISVSLSAAIALVLLFLPKVYIILWAPEKNTRGAFTTSKDVRCHIGSKSIQSSDSVEFREGRYDAFSRSDSKVQKSWRQKSLDEKKLRFVMKRSSIPSQGSAVSPSINHGALTNHKAAASSSCSVASVQSDGKPCDVKKVSLCDQQRHLYMDDFSDYDRLLEDTTKDGGGERITDGSSTGGEARYRDGQCQTGDDLLQALFLQLRRRRFGNWHVSTTTTTNHHAISASPPPHPIREFDSVKEVTFNTQVVVPVQVDKAWWADVPEQVPLLADSATEDDRSHSQDHLFSAEADRRLSGASWSSLGVRNGGRDDDTGTRSGNATSLHHRFRHSTTEASPSNTSSCTRRPIAPHPHHRPHNFCHHRPPTPRTPRKLLIHNNHCDVTADGGTIPLPAPPSGESLPSPHLLHVQGSLASSCHSLDSVTSRGSGGDGVVGVCAERKESEIGPVDDPDVIEFHQYLFDRGLNLDLSTVQTSIL